MASIYLNSTNRPLVFLVTLACGAAFAANPSGDSRTSDAVRSEFIFTPGGAPFAECHASTIIEARHGLLAAWFGGTREGSLDVAIWSSRFATNSWDPPQRAADGVQADGRRFPCWNPVLFEPRTGPLILFYKVGPDPAHWWGMWKKSTDSGVTWSQGQRLPDGILGPIKNKPVELANGDWLCPSSSEIDGWRVHFERTSDAGQTWRSTPPINDGKEIAAIQPTLLFHANRWQALVRTRQSKIYESWSEDNGEHWTKLAATSLPNPNSGIDAVTLKDGRALLVYNHTTRGRTPLNVAVSGNGRDWQQILLLESAPGEYSYPAVIQAADARVHITYTWKRKAIKHAVLEAAKLTPADKPESDRAPTR